MTWPNQQMAYRRLLVVYLVENYKSTSHFFASLAAFEFDQAVQVYERALKPARPGPWSGFLEWKFHSFRLPLPLTILSLRTNEPLPISLFPLIPQSFFFAFSTIPSFSNFDLRALHQRPWSKPRYSQHRKTVPVAYQIEFSLVFFFCSLLFIYLVWFLRKFGKIKLILIRSFRFFVLWHLWRTDFFTRRAEFEVRDSWVSFPFSLSLAFPNSLSIQTEVLLNKFFLFFNPLVFSQNLLWLIELGSVSAIKLFGILFFILS